MRKHKGKTVRGTKSGFINKSEEGLAVLLENLYKVRQEYYARCAPIYKEIKQVGIRKGDYRFRENIFARVRVDPVGEVNKSTPDRDNDIYVSFYREIIE